MRLSLPLRRIIETSATLVATCGALSCTPQQVVVEKPCPPVEYAVVNAPANAPAANDAAAARTLDVRLTPARNDAGNVIAVDVAMRFSVPPVDFGNADPIVLHLDPHIAGAAIGDRIDDLTARDSEGSLGLRRVVETEKGKPTRAEWKAERRARGPVTVSYRVELLADDAARDEVISSAGGVLGIGRALFLMPSTTEAYAIHVGWDLQALGTGARGTSSFGADESEVEGPPSILEDALWVAGQLEEMTIRSPTTNDREGGRFRMISLGKSPLDVTEVGPWANRAWLAVRDVATNAREFDLFVRPAGKPGSRFEVSVFGHSGIGRAENEVKFAWQEKLRLTEVFLHAARGTNLMNQRWFDEGFDTYLAIDALRKTGLAVPSDIAAEIAKRSERYFASPWLRLPLAQLLTQKDATATAHIEDRGLFLAAEIDAKIRASSSGKRSLAHFIRSLEPAAPAATDMTDIPKSTELSTTFFTKALEKEMGAEAVSRYQAIVESASAQANLPDDAFGPCFKKVNKKIQREESGSKKRESIDGFTFSLVPKLPPHCGNAVVAAQVGGLQKTP